MNTSGVLTTSKQQNVKTMHYFFKLFTLYTFYKDLNYDMKYIKTLMLTVAGGCSPTHANV